MPRLPIVGDDDGIWGQILIDYLLQAHDANGDIKAGAVTKASIGLANVDNTSDDDKPVSTATQTALDGKAAATRSIATSGSLTGGGNLTADRTISLVNDNATPGNRKYYGTNVSGTKGDHDLPSGGVLAGPAYHSMCDANWGSTYGSFTSDSGHTFHWVRANPAYDIQTCSLDRGVISLGYLRSLPHI